ncbi:MAG: polysaccharide pyruvyl transferase family protein [Flavobacteriales bacterium]|nr:polysaccharide pyruvyl transferase family protein [Flavobacteriales bacterium]
MEKKINLFWYRHHKGKGNFGDELNPYIVENISQQKVNHINLIYLRDNLWLSFKILVMALLYRKINFITFGKYVSFNLLVRPKVLLAVGSVLQNIQYSNCQVWGAGIIEEKCNFKNADFVSVRGKYSQIRLKELGYKVPSVLGDPAILLPLIYKPEKIKKYKVGIIPHYIHYDELKKAVPSDILVINLLDDIEKIINEICSCEFTLSTSLHGIIVSHVYGIPSLWCNFSNIKKPLRGDNVKFKDYFSSVGIREYDEFLIHIAEIEHIPNLLHEVINQYQLLPDQDLIKHLQKDLLRVAPFALKDEYMKLLK